MIRPDYPTREVVIADLREELKSTRKGFTDFSKCRLTPNITKIVDEITNSAKVDRGLVFLGLLAAAAGLDQGVHQVVNKQTGQVNKLSILILGAGEAGAGKSTALEPFLNIIHEIQPTFPEGYQERIDALEKRINKLNKEYANSGDEKFIKEAISVRKMIDEIQNIPQLLTSDTSKAAFVKMMSKQGFVFRMEPDGISFSSDLHRLITKAWSDEAHSEARISRDGNKYEHPAIFDLVYTQPPYYYEVIHSKKVNESGLLPRTLCYFTNIRDDKNDLTPQRPIDKDCLEFTKNKLMDIFTTAINSKENINIYLSDNAYTSLNEFEEDMKSSIDDGSVDDIKGWAIRAAQHAIRIAGIIQILECDPMVRPYITFEYMNTAIEIVKILKLNLYECVHGFPDDKLREITCKIGIIILEKNLGTFNETEFKQRLKSKYNAEEVNDALRELEYRGIISRYVDRNTRERRRGRPAGTTYINNYYEAFLGTRWGGSNFF